jgi:hypothetical protein
VITSAFASRRAERFAQLLDEAAGARRHHVRSIADGDLADLVATSQRVSTLPLAVEVDNEFRTGLRASLMAHIEREGIGVTATEPEAEAPARRRIGHLLPGSRTRGAIIVTITAGAFAAFGVSAASGDAIPGDALYGVKRSTERAQLVFAGSDVSRGQLYFEFAKVRLAEAGAMGSDLNRLDPVLNDMDNGTRHGTKLLTTAAVQRGEVAGLQAVQQFVEQQRPTMRNLVNRLNGPSRSRAAESLALLDLVGRRAGSLESTIKCPGANVPVDELGAKPVLCSTASSGQQPGTRGAPGVTAPESSPQPGASTEPGADAEPAAAIPSVEAGSSSSPGTTSDQGSSDDGVMDTIGRVIDKVIPG